jgi:lysine biosynthesis protein LysW
MIGECPQCHGQVSIEGAKVLGQRVECPTCKARLEIVGFTPLSLDWAFEAPIKKQSRKEVSPAQHELE